MHIPDIEKYDITHFSFVQADRLSRQNPGAKLYVVPNSKNATTLNDIEKYDISNIGLWRCICLSLCCTRRNRLYLVPRESTANDPPPSYRSVIASMCARDSGRGRQATIASQRSSTALPIAQHSHAYGVPNTASSSTLPRQTSKTQGKTFGTIDSDLNELARLCAYRSNVIEMFFTRATTRCGLPPVPALAADLDRLAQSLHALRPILRSAANGLHCSTRKEILEDGLRLTAGLSRWMDKRKTTFNELRMGMFGTNEGHMLQVAPGLFEELAEAVRTMERGCLVMIDRVLALRGIVGNTLLPQTHPSTGMLSSNFASSTSPPSTNHIPRAEDLRASFERQCVEQKQNIAMHRQQAAPKNTTAPRRRFVVTRHTEI